MGKNPPAVQELQETWVRSLGQEDPLEEGMATHSSALAWRIPRTEEPGACSPYGLRELDMIEATEHSCTVVLKFTFNFFLLLHMVIFTAFK